MRGLGRAEAERRIGDALRLVRLLGFERRQPSQLSGGQQQRVALARAVVFEPEILLLDEPLGALDRKLREQLQVELRQLQRSLGITTILVTHDQEEALAVRPDRGPGPGPGPADRHAEDAYLRPANRFVADFLGTANLFEGILERDGAGWGVRLEDGASSPAPIRVAPGRRVAAIVRPERVMVAPAEWASGLAARRRRDLPRPVAALPPRHPAAKAVVATSTDRGARRPPARRSPELAPDDVWVIPE